MSDDREYEVAVERTIDARKRICLRGFVPEGVKRFHIVRQPDDSIKLYPIVSKLWKPGD